MKKTITISIEDFKMLWEHLNKATEILDSLGIDGSVKAPVIPPKKVRETKADKINKYLKMLESGARGEKPDHLKK